MLQSIHKTVRESSEKQGKKWEEGAWLTSVCLHLVLRVGRLHKDLRRITAGTWDGLFILWWDFHVKAINQTVGISVRITAGTKTARARMCQPSGGPVLSAPVCESFLSRQCGLSQPGRQPVTLNIPWTARKSCRGVPDPQRVKPAALGYTPFLWSWNPAEQIPHLTSGASLLFLDLVHFLTLTSFILDILKSQLIRANWIIVMFLF